ncbi:coactosin-like protein isoform X1 [Monodelphis domestica]|uniref:coactosin-like protein isoform X1 n=1 Tax=Monodelphis domestica TaxID=13616 RepID=UPI0024E1B2BA|nr:coactosin-like protein isoform X1 [Monodelphis domestica]
MATKIDKEACREAYNLVRDDSTNVIWVTFKYNGSTIVPGEQGTEYQSFIQECTDDIRLFGFVRFTTGDAMSKRVKFALITWIGENVSGLQRAKTGTDKTLVKEVVQVILLLLVKMTTMMMIVDFSTVLSGLPNTLYLLLFLIFYICF